jgi:hypothetical protein
MVIAFEGARGDQISSGRWAVADIEKEESATARGLVEEHIANTFDR